VVVVKHLRLADPGGAGRRFFGPCRWGSGQIRPEGKTVWDRRCLVVGRRAANGRAAIITRGLAEMSRITLAKGGNPMAVGGAG